MRIGRAIDLFEIKLAEDLCTKATRRKYCHDVLYPFAEGFDAETQVDEVTKDDCRLYLGRWLDAAPATRALYVSILTVFFAFCVEEGWLERSPMEGIKRPRLKRSEDLDVVSVSADEVGRLFAACEEVDELLCVALLVYTGARRRAAARLKWGDIDFIRGEARFQEKGGKINVQPLADELREILYSVGLAGQVPVSPQDYVIPNRQSGQQGQGVAYRSLAGHERSPKVVYKLIKGVGERAGIEVHPHALRAAFAVHYDEANPANLIALKELLGHARVETTLTYLRRKDKAKAKETVRGLSWASQLQPSSHVPPAGFEPALGESTLPEPLLTKLDELRARSAARRRKPGDVRRR